MRYIGILVLVVLAAGAVRGEPPVVFRDSVAPILAQRCQACHGAAKAAGEFRLDTFARLTQKGDVGPAVVPGKAAESNLYKVLVTTEADKRMPRKANPLAAAEIELIRRWIDEGAKFDGDPNADIASLVPARAAPEPPQTYPAALPVFAVAFAPDGKELATGGYHEVLVWDPASGKLLRRIKGVSRQIQGLAYSSDGKLLAVASGIPGEYGELRTFDPNTGKQVRTFDTSGDVLLAVAFSPDGQRIASAGADRTVRIYDTDGGKEVQRIKQNADWVTSIAFSRDGAALAAGSRDQMVKVFDPTSGRLQAAYPGHHARVFAVAFDPDAARLCTAGADQRLHIWDPKAVAAADGTAGQMEERFRKDPPVALISGTGQAILALAIADRQVFAASADGLIRQYDLETRKPIREYPGGRDWVNAVAVHAKEHRLAAAAYDGTVQVWNTETGESVIRFTAVPH
jgi:WD40 repeat protein/mono/diheme cytochrome c family protein